MTLNHLINTLTSIRKSNNDLGAREVIISRESQIAEVESVQVINQQTEIAISGFNFRTSFISKVDEEKK